MEKMGKKTTRYISSSSLGGGTGRSLPSPIALVKVGYMFLFSWSVLWYSDEILFDIKFV